MKNKLYEEIRQGKKEPCAVLGLSNFGGLAIFDLVYGIEDTITSGFCYGDEITDIRTTKIYYTATGAYIKRFGVKYSLDEFIRM